MNEPLSNEELERIKALCERKPYFMRLNAKAVLLKCVAEITRLQTELAEAKDLKTEFASTYRIEIDRLKSITTETTVAALQKYNERLCTELAEARKDKERLDGFIELAKFTQLTFSISFNGYADLQLQSGRCFSDFTNPRLLIDAAVAAMKATPKPEVKARWIPELQKRGVKL